MDEDYFRNLDAEDLDKLVEDDEHAAPGNDEAEEAPNPAKVRDVKPKKPVINPRPKLDDKRLKGPRGLIVLEDLMSQVKFRGKGHEVQDMNAVMTVLEHWAHRLFPKMTFDDCLEKIETLGHKKSVSSYVTLIRMGSVDASDVQDQPLVSPSTSPVHQPSSPPPPSNDEIFNRLISPAPRPVSQPSELTPEQKARIEHNRLLAEERRLARFKAKQAEASAQPETAAQPQFRSLDPS